MPKKVKRHATRSPRTKRTIPLATRCKLIDTLIDGAIDGLPRKHRDAVAKHLVERALVLFSDTHGLDPNSPIVVIHPTHGTSRLLNAIDNHIEATDEDSGDVVARLIACLGTKAAADAQAN